MIEGIVTYAEILFSRITGKWLATPFFSNSLRVTGSFLLMILTSIRVYLVAIAILIIMDMLSGIGASLKNGEKFDSGKIKKGLLERIVLYGSLIIITLAIDSMVRGTWDYGSYYVTMFSCTVIGFYEAGSCIENLITLYPQYTFLKKIANMLNLLEKTYEKNTVGKVQEILKEDKDEKSNK